MEPGEEQDFHYGQIIKAYRKASGMKQRDLASIWHEPDGDVHIRYIQEVESGRTKLTDPNQLRYLSSILNIPLWKLGLSEYDPFHNTHSIRGTSSMYDETLNAIESLIKRTWYLRRVAPLSYVEEAVQDINRLLSSPRDHIPPPQRLEKRYQILSAQSLRLNAVIDVEHKRYEAALAKFIQMNEIATHIDHPATLALSLLGKGTELDRLGRHSEAIDCLEAARDESFRASKHVAALVNAYLARVYSSQGRADQFKKAISTAEKIAREIHLYYGDGTDFVFHSLSGILAEKSYGYLQIKEPENTLAMKEEIKKEIKKEGNVWLDSWIPLDWALAHLMLGHIPESVEAGQEFYQKATAINSPHAKSRAFKLLNTIETAGHANDAIVQAFHHELYMSADDGETYPDEVYSL